MAFSDNLIYLRKQLNYTQEELAERLGVTRQTVSKWEGGLCYPEMDKILALCDLSGCSLELLMRGSLEDGSFAPPLHTEQTETADQSERVAAAFSQLCRYAAGIAAGVFLVLLGVAACVFCASYGQERMEIIGAAVLLVLIAAAVFLFIISGLSNRNAQIEDGRSVSYPASLRRRIARHQAITVSVATAMILLGVACLILCSSLSEPALVRVTAAFLLLIGVSAFLYVYDGIRFFYVSERQTSRKSRKNKRSDRLEETVSGVIMLSATALFLLLGFLFSLWHPAWIVFPIGGIACGIASTVIHAHDTSDDDKDDDEDEDEKDEDAEEDTDR